MILGLSVANDNAGVLYATMQYSNDNKTVLQAALSALLKSTENGEGKLLYSLYYEQEQQPTSLDLAFNDEILQAVEDQWKSIMADENGVVKASFMQFEEREGMNNDDDGDEGF